MLVMQNKYSVIYHRPDVLETTAQNGSAGKSSHTVVRLYHKIEWYWQHPVPAGEVTAFHLEEYVNFLSHICPDSGSNSGTMFPQ